MAITLQPFLFKWEAVDARSDLDRLRLVLEALPDEALVRKRGAASGPGRQFGPGLLERAAGRARCLARGDRAGGR